MQLTLTRTQHSSALILIKRFNKIFSKINKRRRKR